MIGIIDIGNAQSVENALSKLGYACVRSLEPKKLEVCTSLILPGVGEFGTVMKNILPLTDLIKGWKRPFLGICAGMQVLFETSEESPGVEGLGIMKGTVKRFQNIRIPQIGWNSLENVAESLLGNGEYAYFVNSYYCVPNEPVVTSTATYGIDFAASVRKNNFIGMQFHPEKSGAYGLRVLEQFGRSST